MASKWLELCDGFVHFPFLKKGVAQIVMGLGITWFRFQRLA